MINAIKRIISNRQKSTVFGAYLNSVRTDGDRSGPTFDEARRDFASVVQRYGFN